MPKGHAWMDIEKLMRKRVGRAIGKYNLIEDGDSIGVGVSGGKDSLTLLCILNNLSKRAPIKYSVNAIVYDPGFSGFYSDISDELIPFFDKIGVGYDIIRDQIFKHLKTDSTPCAFCSRMRRGKIVSLCLEKGYNKLALGHHSLDSIETLFMNMLYSGVMRGMPPIYKTEKGINLIRPMIMCRENEIVEFTLKHALPVIKSFCPAYKMKTLKRKNIREEIKGFVNRMNGDMDVMAASLTNLQANTFSDSKYL